MCDEIINALMDIGHADANAEPCIDSNVYSVERQSRAKSSGQCGDGVPQTIPTFLAE